MADLIIPDESYVSLEEADKYHGSRPSFHEWNALDEDTKRRRLVGASDFLDFSYKFLSEKVDPEQPREFPRKQTGGLDKHGIPKQIKYAVFELALYGDLNQNEEQKMSSVKVGPLSVNYSQSSEIIGQVNRFTFVKTLLDLFLDKNTGYGYSKILRG